MTCLACGKPEDWCRCRHWCELCRCTTNHTSRQHADAIVEAADGADDCPA